jgi:hypothetical protein
MHVLVLVSNAQQPQWSTQGLPSGNNSYVLGLQDSEYMSRASVRQHTSWVTTQ